MNTSTSYYTPAWYHTLTTLQYNRGKLRNSIVQGKHVLVHSKDSSQYIVVVYLSRYSYCYVSKAKWKTHFPIAVPPGAAQAPPARPREPYHGHDANARMMGGQRQQTRWMGERVSCQQSQPTTKQKKQNEIKKVLLDGSARNNKKEKVLRTHTRMSTEKWSRLSIRRRAQVRAFSNNSLPGRYEPETSPSRPACLCC